MPYRKYPILPVIGWALRILAIILLMFFVYELASQMQLIGKNWAELKAQPGIAEKLAAFIVDSLLVKYLVQAFLYWGFGEVLFALRDIEFNTRYAGHVAEAEAAMNVDEEPEAIVPPTPPSAPEPPAA